MPQQEPPFIPFQPIPETEPVLGSSLQVGKKYSRRGRFLGAYQAYITQVHPNVVLPFRPYFLFDKDYVNGGMNLTFTEVV